MLRRSLLTLPFLLGAIALPAAPALAGEDEDDAPSATLRATQGCVSGDRATADVTGDEINAVAFFVDGDRLRTVRTPDARGRFRISMDCSELSLGAHRASAVVQFTEGSSPARQTLRFQITRVRQGSPRFTG